MNTYRKPLDFSSIPATIQDMIEDNSSAAAIIDELIEKKGESSTIPLLIILDDMNIRGIQIVTLYNMCNQNIEKLNEKITNITEEDIDALNSKVFAICKFKAVFTGTKEDRLKEPDKYIFTDEERNNIRNKKSKDRVHDILENKASKNQKNDDLYPSITSAEALSIINKHGFNCGYKKTYENKDGKTVTYRVFYNEFGDIMYTHSLENPDIFLWGESKLNVVRQTSNKKYEELGCNTYLNIKGLAGYNIELREKPFATYQKVLDRKEKTVTNIKPEYYNSNLFPIIESIDGIKYKQNHSNYKGLVISSIYNLLTFPETYYDMDEKLKHLYKILLSYAEDKAYDEVLYQLNSDNGIEIANKIQDVLGINLDKDKLIAAKQRLRKANNRLFEIPKSKFLSHLVVEDPFDKEINKRITKLVVKKDKITIK